MSEIILDTITGKSTATTITIGSTPVVSSSANSMTIRGEGTAQTSIQQGLAKGWGHFVGSDSSISYSDSFNLSGLTDNSPGKHTVSYSTNMGNATYSAQCSGGTNRNGQFDNGTIASGSATIETKDSNNTFIDSSYVMFSMDGDLA
jgi:hypothetical protein